MRYLPSRQKDGKNDTWIMWTKNVEIKQNYRKKIEQFVINRNDSETSSGEREWQQ